MTTPQPKDFRAEPGAMYDPATYTSPIHDALLQAAKEANHDQRVAAGLEPDLSDLLYSPVPKEYEDREAWLKDYILKEIIGDLLSQAVPLADFEGDDMYKTIVVPVEAVKAQRAKLGVDNGRS